MESTEDTRPRRRPEPPFDHRAPIPRVLGDFQTRRGAGKAVRTLLQRGVPTNTLTVLTRGPDGRTTHEVRIENEPGAKRGALVGAGVGAAIGALMVAAFAGGALGLPAVDPFGVGSAFGAFRAIALGAVAGIGLGALLGLGGWSGRMRLPPNGGKGRSFVVVAETRSLVERAAAALREAGAQQVVVEEPRAAGR